MKCSVLPQNMQQSVWLGGACGHVYSHLVTELCAICCAGAGTVLGSKLASSIMTEVLMGAGTAGAMGGSKNITALKTSLIG